MENLFGRQPLQLLEVLWEALNEFLRARADLILNRKKYIFWGPRFVGYTTAVKGKRKELKNIVESIYVMVIRMDRLGGDKMLQRVMYKGQRRKNALKYQDINTPCSLVMYLPGPMEGRCHDWSFYLQSGVEEILPAVPADMKGDAYFVCGDSGYSASAFL